MKQQFVELLSDIGFVKEGIVAKDVERAARSGGDGIATITGEEVRQFLSPEKKIQFICYSFVSYEPMHIKVSSAKVICI